MANRPVNHRRPTNDDVGRRGREPLGRNPSAFLSSWLSGLCCGGFRRPFSSVRIEHGGSLSGDRRRVSFTNFIRIWPPAVWFGESGRWCVLMDTLTDVSAGSWVAGGDDLSGTSGFGVGYYCTGMMKLEEDVLCLMWVSEPPSQLWSYCFVMFAT